MELKKSQDRINELMSRFVTEIKGAGAMGGTDINRVSEDVLVPLFSEIYGHKDLRNLNVSEYPNFPAVDLGDKKTRTAYQITSDSRSDKIKDTLRKFVKHELYKEYSKLIIYILTEKQKTYQGGGFDEIIQGKFSFDPKINIRDYQDLLETISGFPSVDKLRRIENILEAHFGEPEFTRPLDPLDWLDKVDNLWGEESTTIKINREKLLKDLHDFALRGSGVIIGSPGVGKTYLLKELRQSLKSEGIPHLLLPIDRLWDGTPETLHQALSYNDDLIEKLKSVPVSDKKAILLFDAFDAARNEQTRQRFLQLIRRAIRELNGWHVVVTVRTYDANKSQELLDLFGHLDNNDLTQNHRKGILCRHFEIPPLNEDEIGQVFDQIQPLKHIYHSGSPEFKQLLANPFNLWLLEKILKNPQDVHALSQIHSEVQLLDRFWQRRNEDESDELHRRFLLEQIVCWMIKKRSLTVRQNDVYKDLGIDNPARLRAWNELLSDEILAKVPSTGQLIAFSHDILFDYAISALLIEEEPKQLKNFILQHPSHPIFLRPSFTYFFTRLWYDAPDTFWDVFWHIFPIKQPVHLRLARLIPTSVIASEAREVDQMTPLLDKLEMGESIANDAVACLLQSLRALEIEIDELWSKLFDGVSAHLHRDFARDLAILTSEMLKMSKAENTVIIDNCGRVGRQLLAWIWQQRETNEDDWYNRLGSYWAVPLVAKTYGTNTEESRALLNKILELTEEDNFSIDFLTDLTEHVDKIWAHDSEFVGLIYRAGITSTRRQDYSMCHYWLAEHFPNFLRSAPLAASQAAIQSLNVFIIDDRILRYRQDYTKREDLKEKFEFNGELAYFVQDDSHAWDEREILAEPIKVADALFEFIAELARSNDSLLDSLLDVFRDYAEVALFWKRLLKIAAQFPAVFAPRLFELCIARPILMRDEVMHEIGLFLEAASPEFTPDQLRQVEESILELPRESGDNRKFYEHRRNRLLTHIPLDLLRTNEGKKIREEMERENADPENQPQVGFGSCSGHYAEEEQLQGQDVDVTAPEIQELQRLIEPLKKFSSDWLNGEPTEEASRLILPTLEEGYAAVKEHTEADKQVINRLWYKLGDCTAILARTANDHGSHLFTFCRQMLLHAARHEQPKPNPDLDAQFNSSIFSRFPRHGAAEGLLRLTVHHSDAEILDTIELLSSDPVPSVRMVTAMGLSLVYTKTPDRFWRIVEERATREPNYVVQQQICNTLDRVVRKVPEEEDRTIRVMDRMLKSIPAHAATLQRLHSYVDLLMWLAFSREKPWAIETIKRVFYKTPIHFGNSLQHTVFRVMRDYVVLKHLKTDEGKKTVQLTIAWLKRVVDEASATIEELCDTSNGARTAETKKKLHDIYKVIDEVIMRLYYAAAYERGQSEEISSELRCCFYNQVKPVMEKIVALSQDNRESGVMLAKKAGYFIRTLTSFLSCKPKEVLHLAVGVARSSKQSGYNFDSLAVKDVLKFVEIILADHRNEVRDGQGLKDLQNLLDIFIEAGWSDALRLVGRLDEIFR